MTERLPLLCKDCKHFTRIAQKCMRQGTVVDLVTGEQTVILLDCHKEREGWYDGNCGPSARYWEMSEPQE